jgi:hypothetical protein
MTAQLPIHPEDFDALLKYFTVQDYIDQIKDLALNYRN